MGLVCVHVRVCTYTITEICVVFRVEVVCVKPGGYVCLSGLKARGK